jgi:endogenous inhibitor of DNA gyrase (YacG/DUF329 family)
MIDFGKWADEEYSVPTGPDAAEQVDQTPLSGDGDIASEHGRLRD